MKINILGSGTCVPSIERSASAILIRLKKRYILVDLGSGTMRQLLKLGISIDQIDLILLTHFHLDHCGELASFLFATKYPNFDRIKKLILAGGIGIKKLFRSLEAAFGDHIVLPCEFFEILEMNESGQINLFDNLLSLAYVKTVHRPESLAFRFTDSANFSLVCSGDTDYSDSLVKFAEKADVFICESSLPDDKKVPGHLTPSLAGKVAARAGVRKLVLTHFYPESFEELVVKQCRKTYGGKLVLAQDLIEV